MFRAVNQNPTDAEIDEIIKEWDKDGSGKFNLATYFRLMDSPAVKVGTCFRLMDSSAVKVRMEVYGMKKSFLHHSRFTFHHSLID